MGIARPWSSPADRGALPRAGVSSVCRSISKIFQSETVNQHLEDARVAAAGPREVTLYTRPGCHLCEEAKAAVAPLIGEFGAALREVNIDDDAALRQRYG